MYYSTLSQWQLKDKRVFVRADLNVPLVNGKIINDFRLTSILPTIDFILKHNGSIVLATHIGEPKNSDSKLSTKIIIPWFVQRGYSILFMENLTAIAQLKVSPGQIILMENLRFFPGEKNGDPFFAKQLGNTAHFYVNDAFGVVHRNDCSVTLLPYEFPENRRSIGFLMEKELHALNTLKDNPSHPFIAILGGGKVEDKIPLIHNLIKKVDVLLLCPALCFSFLKSLAQPVGQSLVNDSMMTLCKKIIIEAENSHVSYLFPVDYQVSYDAINGPLSIVSATNFPDNAIGISIGPKTVTQFTAEINRAKTVLLNCAMGFADRPETRQSTKDLINAMAQSSAKTVIAGGDSVDVALNTKNYQLIDHLSTGGGAALAYLSGTLLPGLAAFEEK
ncbi:MAG TPA: phosphoglycerate kinase [Candidatus Babeliales bacterium]|jgi:phosphoglycerate kinase|nr:phosphoglycerate kinase [Candidatus Babeliales bacterium]